MIYIYIHTNYQLGCDWSLKTYLRACARGTTAQGGVGGVSGVGGRRSHLTDTQVSLYFKYLKN
jgi:hypothetical protein